MAEWRHRRRKARDGSDRLPAVKDIMDHYWTETQRYHNLRPAISFSRDGAAVKRILLNGVDVNVLKNHITRTVRIGRKGEARLALINILSTFQAQQAIGIPFDEIIAYLNKAAGTEFIAGDPSTVDLISARWRDGYRLPHFEKVIDNMWAKWGRDPKMVEFVRPSTLFSEKFGNYLGLKVTPVDRGTMSPAAYKARLAGEEWLRQEAERERDEEQISTDYAPFNFNDEAGAR